MKLNVDSSKRANSFVESSFFKFKMKVGMRKEKKKSLLIIHLHLDTLAPRSWISRSLSVQKADWRVPLRGSPRDNFITAPLCTSALFSFLVYGTVSLRCSSAVSGSLGIHQKGWRVFRFLWVMWTHWKVNCLWVNPGQLRTVGTSLLSCSAPGLSYLLLLQQLLFSCKRCCFGGILSLTFSNWLLYKEGSW